MHVLPALLINLCQHEVREAGFCLIRQQPLVAWSEPEMRPVCVILLSIIQNTQLLRTKLLLQSVSAGLKVDVYSDVTCLRCLGGHNNEISS